MGAMSERAERVMRIRFNRAMRESDLKKRLAMLETAALATGWHGNAWHDAVREIHRLWDAGVTKRLEDSWSKAEN